MVIPLTDFLSKVFSFRNFIIVNTILFALFSAACAFTHDLPSMIAMRGLQGFAGGVLIPMAFTMVLTKLPKAQQPIGLAAFALAVTFAPAIGPTIGVGGKLGREPLDVDLQRRNVGLQGAHEGGRVILDGA